MSRISSSSAHFTGLIVLVLVGAPAVASEVGPNDFRISDMGPDGNTEFGGGGSAVAYNPTAEEYLVVWFGHDGGGDFPTEGYEIFGQRFDASTGEEVGENDFRISDMGPDGDFNFDAIFPAVVYNPSADEYLVVWQGEDDTGLLVADEFEIYGQRLDGSTGAEIGANDFRISDVGSDGDINFDATRPAVVYNLSADEYLVVWAGDDDIAPLVNAEWEIFGQRLDGSTGAEIGDNDFRISDMGPDGNENFDSFDPAVVYNATADEYLVVWEGDDNPGTLVNDEFEIFGQRLDGSTGAEVGDNDFRISDMGPNGGVRFGAFDPAVAYNATADEYLVVWEGDDNPGTLVRDEFEIFGQRLDGITGAEVGGNDFRISDMGPDGDLAFNAFDPKVVYNAIADEYLVVWEGDDDTGSLANNEFEIYGQRLDGGTGAEVGDNDFRISDMGIDGDSSFVGAFPAIAYGSLRREYLVTWDGDEDIPPLVDNEYEIFGQRLFVPEPSCWLQLIAGLGGLGALYRLRANT